MYTRSTSSLRSPRAALIAGVGVALVLLTGCQSGAVAGSSTSTSATPTKTVPPATLAVQPLDKAVKIAADQKVTVDVVAGTLTDVTVKPTDGALPAVTGQISTDGTAWTSSGGLVPATAYVVTANARNADDRPAQLTSTFTTDKPKSTVSADVTPHAGWMVGVGMPVIVDFTKAVKDRAAVQKAVTVSSTPAVTGAWHWMSSKQAQWRPQKYWASGTKVTVTTALKGVQASPGVWGKASETTAFTIGSANIYRVNVDTHTLVATHNGKVIRTIPITTGKNGFETRNGTKVIMTRESSRRMDAATTGIDAKDPEYYDIDVKWAMRLTWSGEFLHAAPWSVGSQGHANVSHGCTGMSTANAKWLFGQSKVGDVVEYTGSSRKMEWGNGYTLWNMPYSQWATT